MARGLVWYGPGPCRYLKIRWTARVRIRLHLARGSGLIRPKCGWVRSDLVGRVIIASASEKLLGASRFSRDSCVNWPQWARWAASSIPPSLPLSHSFSCLKLYGHNIPVGEAHSLLFSIATTPRRFHSPQTSMSGSDLRSPVPSPHAPFYSNWVRNRLGKFSDAKTLSRSEWS